MTHHRLKTHPAMLNAIRDGSKTFEVRNDDRAFQKGDTIELIHHEETDWQSPAPPRPMFLDENQRKPVKATIGFVLRGGQYGLEPGYVAFSLIDVITVE